MLSNVLRIIIILLLSGALSLAAAAQDKDENKDSDKQPGTLEQIGQQTSDIAGKVGGALLDAVRFLPIPRFSNEGQDGIPVHIAVLPATGFGSDLEREDIRLAIHNNLSARPFELQRPFEVDRQLGVVSQSLNTEWQNVSPAELAKRLRLDGLIFVEVTEIDKLYVAAYAHYEISVKLSFYDATTDAVIWQKEESIAERDGGLSFNPLGIIATAISSSQVLNEATRQTLVDKLARLFEQQIPVPKAGQNRIQPPKLELAFSNYAEGPFRAGDEAMVIVKAESGLIGTFDIGSKLTGMELQETSNGEYLGRYVVQDSDNYADQVIRLNLRRPGDNVRLDWRLAGRISFDTTAPEAITELTASPQDSAVMLAWQTASAQEQNLTFYIDKADDAGRYHNVASVDVRQWRDPDVQRDKQYFYRISSRDAAGNSSAYREISVIAVKAGPTPVVSDINSNMTFYALASPYQISQPIRVLRGVTLTLEAGAIVEFSADAELDILGSLLAEGTADAPVTLRGAGRVHFNNTGQIAHRLAHIQFQGLTAVTASHASLVINAGRFLQATTALELKDNSQLNAEALLFSGNVSGLLASNSRLQLTNSRWTNNQLALQLNDNVELHISDGYFAANQQHITTKNSIAITRTVFDEADYDTLLSRLQGPVQIDWLSVPDEFNLAAKWLTKQWQQILSQVAKQDYLSALQLLQTLTAALPEQHRAAQLSALLTVYQAGRPQQGADNPLLTALNQQLREGKESVLFLQQERLPYSQALIESDHALMQQLANRTNVAFLQSRFSSIGAERISRLRSELQLASQTLASSILHVERQGLFIHVSAMHLLDKVLLDRTLASAGLVERVASPLIIGLLSNGNDYGFGRLLSAGLQQQKLRQMAVGTGSFNQPLRQKIKQDGANLALEYKVSVEETNSNLSANLKMFNVVIDTTVNHILSDKPAQSLTFSRSSAGFQANQVVAKLLQEMYPELESQLLQLIWQAEPDISTALALQQQEEQQRQAKRAAEAKAKAETEMRLKAEAEARLAAETKARLAEEQRLKALTAAKLEAQAKAEAEAKAAALAQAQNEISAAQAAELSPSAGLIPAADTLQLPTNDKPLTITPANPDALPKAAQTPAPPAPVVKDKKLDDTAH